MVCHAYKKKKNKSSLLLIHQDRAKSKTQRKLTRFNPGGLQSNLVVHQNENSSAETENAGCTWPKLTVKKKLII